MEITPSKNQPVTKLAKVIFVIWICVNIGILCGAITLLSQTQYIDIDAVRSEPSPTHDYDCYPWLSSIAMKAYMLFMVKTPFCWWLSRGLLLASLIPILYARISKIKLSGNILLWLPLLMFVQYLNLISLCFILVHGSPVAIP